MSTKSSLCVGPGGKMDWGVKESIGSPFMCSWGGMRRVFCGEWLEVVSLPPSFSCLPRLAQCLGGKLEPFWRLCGDSRGYRWDLAIGRYSCQSCHYLWTLEHACNTVCRHAHMHRNTYAGRRMIKLQPTHTQTNKNMHTRAPKKHLNFESMLHKISRTFLDNLLLLQTSFSLLTLCMPEFHAALWLLLQEHNRGGLTCLPTQVWHYCAVFCSWTWKLPLLKLQIKHHVSTQVLTWSDFMNNFPPAFITHLSRKILCRLALWCNVVCWKPLILQTVSLALNYLFFSCHWLVQHQCFEQFVFCCSSLE